MKAGIVYLAAVGLLLLSCFGCEDRSAQPSPAESGRVVTMTASKPLYEFELHDIDGHPAKLAAHRGKVLLLVNVASKCGYTRQYAGLQSLYEQHRDRGLVVLGFPANNFGAQEPGTNEQIKQFCSMTYGVTFPIFAKISVRGDDIHPLYQFLTSPQTNPRFSGDISWNFNKFLVSREGDVIGRYESTVEPTDARLLADIEGALQAHH